MPIGSNIADADFEQDAETRAQRRRQIFGLVCGIATGLMVATVVFFAFYDRAELQFLFSKPGM
jgi:hypothetical protein